MGSGLESICKQLPATVNYSKTVISQALGSESLSSRTVGSDPVRAWTVSSKTVGTSTTDGTETVDLGTIRRQSECNDQWLPYAVIGSIAGVGLIILIGLTYYIYVRHRANTILQSMRIESDRISRISSA